MEKEQVSITRVLLQRIIPVAALILLMDSVIPGMLEMEGRDFRAIVSSYYLLAIFVAGLWQLAYGLGTNKSRS
jgi:hypothetical protein